MHLSAKDCENYYCSQVSQFGGSEYFRGIPHQRGYGLFGDLKRYITPLVLRAGRYLGKQAMNTGRNVLSDLSSGKSIKDAVRSRFKETSGKMKDDFFKKLQSGSGRAGIKRKNIDKAKHSKVKRCKKDIFS